MRSSGSALELVARARAGDARAVARLISLVEDESPLLREVMAALSPYAGHAHVIGITGPPGVGKSTSTSCLVAEFRRLGKRVGVLAVDPSSPFSGGALLGDRVRMADHATDSEVFIRSMAARGHLGGLAWTTPQALRVLDAAGCQVILIETVGVGQSEVDVAGLADTTVVLLAPGMGDGIQAAKAGILEVADLYVINKADREGAARVAHDLRAMLRLGERAPGSWDPPVLETIASQGVGLGEVVAGDLSARRLARTVGGADAPAHPTGAQRDRGDRADQPAQGLGRSRVALDAGRAGRPGRRRRLRSLLCCRRTAGLPRARLTGSCQRLR